MLKDSHLRLIPIQSHFAETRELALEKLAAKKADGSVVTWECETHACHVPIFACVSILHLKDSRAPSPTPPGELD